MLVYANALVSLVPVCPRGRVRERGGGGEVVASASRIIHALRRKQGIIVKLIECLGRF